MFGIEALDVVIGMIFIYLLFSLLVTILNEFAAQIFEARGKELKFGIEQMLGKDLQEVVYSDERISKSIERSSLFYGTLFWPLIKWIRRIGKIETLKETEAKQKKIQEIVQKFNLWKQVNLIISVISWYRTKNIETDLEAFIKERQVTKTILPSEIPKETFSEILYDLKDKDEYKKRIQTIIKPKDGQPITRKLIEKRFDEMSLYTIDWYKRKLKYKLIFWGLLTSIIFNVNSVSIFKTLVNDPEARTSLVQQAESYIATHDLDSNTGLPIVISKPNSEKDTIEVKGKLGIRLFIENQKAICNGSKSCIDSIKTNFPIIFKLDSTYSKLDNLIQGEISTASSTLGMGWDFGSYEIKFCSWLEAQFWSMIWAQSGFKGMIGWIITALALSLGAPFWFDLLRKVVNIKNEVNGKEATKERVG